MCVWWREDVWNFIIYHVQPDHLVFQETKPSYNDVMPFTQEQIYFIFSFIISKILYNIQFKTDFYHLLVDDGRGVSYIQKGGGLRGLDDAAHPSAPI